MNTQTTAKNFQATRKFKPNGLSVESVVAAYCVVSIFSPLALPGMKVFAYAVPFVCLIALLASCRFSIPANAPPYLVVIGAGLALAPIGTLKGLQDLWLILIGLAPFAFGYQYKIGWKTVFIITVAITLANVAIAAATGHGSGFEIDVLNSTSTFESSTSFIFGALAAWAVLERRWGRVAIAIIMAILTLKRIAVLAGMVVLIVALLPRRPVDMLLRPIPMLVLNILFIILTINYAQGNFDGWIKKTSGQSSDQLGVGRQQLYAPPVKLLEKKPVQFAFYGVGAGGIYDVIKTAANFKAARNMHNDSLKILIEYGGIVWICVFSIFYWNKRFEVRAMMLYTNILWLTDNSLIYYFVVFPTSLAVLALSKQPEPQPVRRASLINSGNGHIAMSV